MNTMWSTYIQGIGTLYESRRLRFSDLFRDKYMPFWDFADGAKICEIGCGPGALAESLHRWYPNAEVYGVDRDSNFIAFAQKNHADIRYREGDAASLPFEDSSFDVTISNTVAEHIAPEVFYGEQKRVLKEGGSCVVLSARKGIYIAAPCVTQESDFEKDVRSRVGKYYDDVMKEHAICAYPQSESELPLSMEKNGFRDVRTEYITINLTPDDPAYSKEAAYAMIHANRQAALDHIDSLLSVASGIMTQDEADQMKELTNAKYNKRIALYDAGIKQWDTNMSLTMMVKGTK